MSVIFWILGALLLLAVDFLIAWEFRKIAVIKGWNSKKYFFYAFFFTLAGYLMIQALPDRGSISEGSFESGDLPEL